MNERLHAATSVEVQSQPNKDLHPDSSSLDLPVPMTLELPLATTTEHHPPTSSEPPAPVTTGPYAATSSESSAPTSTELPPLATAEHVALLPSPDVRGSYHHRLQEFEKELGPAVLRENVKAYERELVSMMAQDVRFRETIAVKERHITRLKNLLHTWSTTTVSERREFGDYYAQEDIVETLQRQTRTAAELRGALNCLKYELETVRVRISRTWEIIERAEKTEKGPVVKGRQVCMTAGESNENSMQIDS